MSDKCPQCGASSEAAKDRIITINRLREERDKLADEIADVKLAVATAAQPAPHPAPAAEPLSENDLGRLDDWQPAIMGQARLAELVRRAAAEIRALRQQLAEVVAERDAARADAEWMRAALTKLGGAYDVSLEARESLEDAALSARPAPAAVVPAYPECLTTAERVLIASAFADRRREVAVNASLCRRTTDCPSCYMMPRVVRHAGHPTICARTVLHILDNA